MANTETIRYEAPITVGDLRALRADEYGIYTLGAGVYAEGEPDVVTGIFLDDDGSANLVLDDGEPMTLSEFLDIYEVSELDDTERLFVSTDTGWYTLAEAVIEDTAMASYVWLMG